MVGYALTIILMFPLFHWMASAANPELAAAMQHHPVTVQGTSCAYNPFATRQATPCGRALDTLTRRGIAYTFVPAPGWTGDSYQVRIGVAIVNAEDPAALEPALAGAGYRLEKSTPPLGRAIQVVLAIIVIGFLSGMTYGPVAALLVELFPARVRYTSLSVPYHIGTGYFGGFLPFISQYIVARTGDPFSGLWYTIAVVAMALGRHPVLAARDRGQEARLGRREIQVPGDQQDEARREGGAGPGGEQDRGDRDRGAGRQREEQRPGAANQRGRQ